ncbi:neuraminidase-like domain-containing protein [Vibrio artabrorum]|uniref:Tc toxin subunit A-related protein n=1 Tax=Vibrio artabrorum TaxID=446374 RepID=UPI003553A98D
MTQYIPEHYKNYVCDGSVASVYSPAAYLQELWSKAKGLHNDKSHRSLLKRRPDLADMALSQDNMDTEVSRLLLSNNLLFSMLSNFNVDTNFLSTQRYASYYHEPLEILRYWVVSLADDPSPLINESVAERIYAGNKIFITSKDSIPKNAQVWALINIHGQVEEEAKVMCGFDISTTKGEINGKEQPSQINRLFGVSNDKLPEFKDNNVLSKTLMQAFGINSTELDLLVSLTHVKLTANISLPDVSQLYSWVLLSRSLGCKIAELVILNNLVGTPQVWERYIKFESVLDWISDKNITVSDLLLLTSIPSYSGSSEMDAIESELNHEKAVTTKETLAKYIAGICNLPNPKLVESAMPQDDFKLFNRPRFIYIEHSSAAYISTNSFSILRNGKKNKINFAAPDGNGKWALCKVDGGFSIGDTIEIERAIGFTTSNMLDDSQVNVYVSDADLTSEIQHQKLTNENDKLTLSGSFELMFKDNVATFKCRYNDEIEYANKTLQHVLIANRLGLTANTLEMLLTPNNPVVDSSQSSYTLEQLQQLTQLQAMVERCGSHSSKFLEDLSRQQLTLPNFEHYLNLNLSKQDTLLLSTGSETLTLPIASDILNVYLFSLKSGVSLSNLIKLQKFKAKSSFAQWEEIANLLLDELPSERFDFVQQKKEEGLSRALSSYYCKVYGLNGIDELSSYLLTDLQSSGEVKTSKIAWAIASIQLYVDRCLNGQEPDVVEGVKDDQFFENWGRDNSRYSQWAGLQELLFEPENYIDPSLRLNATDSFKHLQETLASHSINEDVAETAFYDYLSEFENMSEIMYLNAYHDSDITHTDSGVTWFVGKSKGTPTHWYWRSLDHSKLTAQAGAVQAWSGWSKISIPINPIETLQGPVIRPVEFNGRLYLAWLEARDKKSSSTSEKTSSTKPNSIKECIFRIAHLTYDGSWTMPTETVLTLDDDTQKDFELGKYAYLNMYITNATIINQIQLVINLKEWIVNVQTGYLATEHNKPSFVKGGTLREAHSAIINGNSDIKKVVAYPYSATKLSDDIYTLKNLTTKRPNGQVVDLPIEKYTFTMDTASTGRAIFFILGNVIVVNCSVTSKGEVKSSGAYVFSSFNVNGITAFSFTAEIASITVPKISLKNCITISKDTYTPDNWELNIPNKASFPLLSRFPTELLKLTTQGIDAVFSLKEQRKFKDNLRKVLDFEGALGCYYWELFYHVPLLISQQLQQSEDYSTAEKWLGYVFNPTKDLVWKPLPLHDDYSWRPRNTNTQDPDVIAESDPMHYKLATFMQLLDLLIARGDRAYRMLERDTLVEAQMWYHQALNLLGPQPYLSMSASTELPLLNKATSKSFQPQENKKLNSYWLLLKQRLYNLRHNLTLDGLPLNLPLFSSPANPERLLSEELNTSNNASTTSISAMRLLRFKPALEHARNLARQLVQFGNSLQGIIEQQDAESMSQMLQTQANQLMTISCSMQDKTLKAIDQELASLNAQLDEITLRKTHYTTLYDENVSEKEKASLALNHTAAALLIAGGASNVVGGALDTAAPNIFGLADGGNRWGGVANGIGALLANTAFSFSNTAGTLEQAERYRRRRDEWKLEVDTTDKQLKQINSRIAALNIRRESANMQKTYLQTQQRHMDDKLAFLKNKFTNQRLFGWMRSRLSIIFSQFYDITLTAALMAEGAYLFEFPAKNRGFIRPSAWGDNYSGLLCGESLLLDLAQLENTWLSEKQRELEVTRTVSVAELINSSSSNKEGNFSDVLNSVLSTNDRHSWPIKSDSPLRHSLSKNNNILECAIVLAGLNIPADYPTELGLGSKRRIKNISVSLPALIGPYQDIQAVLEYTEPSFTLPPGCSVIAVSHGVNDSGQFRLDFNDPYYLPFEGIMLPDIDDNKGGQLVLRFPMNKQSQKRMLASLNDIVLHIHYTIMN